MQEFTRGDLLRGPRAFLLDPAGANINLIGNTIVFRMTRKKDGTLKVNDQVAIVVDEANGEVRYDWQTTDIDETGEFSAWFIRTSGGLTEHHPLDGYTIKVVDDF